jgi:RNA recognition motif-containing protein
MFAESGVPSAPPSVAAKPAPQSLSLDWGLDLKTTGVASMSWQDLVPGASPDQTAQRRSESPISVDGDAPDGTEPRVSDPGMRSFTSTSHHRPEAAAAGLSMGPASMSANAALKPFDDQHILTFINNVNHSITPGSAMPPPAGASTSTAAPAPSSPETSMDPPQAGANLFVAGLTPTVDDVALEAAFAQFGEIQSAKVMLHVDTAVSRGFGFVLFKHPEHANAARACMHGKPMPNGHGGRLQISVSKHRGENLSAESRVVYVRNVPTVIPQDQLEVFFRHFGDVEKFQVRGTRAANSVSTLSMSSNNLSTDASLANIVVEFATAAAARACVAATHGKMPFTECSMPLLAKVEEPQQLRDQRLKATRYATQTTPPPAPMRRTDTLPAPTVSMPLVAPRVAPQMTAAGLMSQAMHAAALQQQQQQAMQQQHAAGAQQQMMYNPAQMQQAVQYAAPMQYTPQQMAQLQAQAQAHAQAAANMQYAAQIAAMQQQQQQQQQAAMNHAAMYQQAAAAAGMQPQPQQHVAYGYPGAYGAPMAYHQQMAYPGAPAMYAAMQPQAGGYAAPPQMAAPQGYPGMYAVPGQAPPMAWPPQQQPRQ